jgi:vancomycin resistance protein YoaR
VQNDQAVIQVGTMSPGRIRSTVSGFFELPASTQTWRQRLSRGGSRLLLVLAIVVGVVALALLLMRGMYSDRVYPQVSVSGMNIGGLTRDEARAVLEARSVELEYGSVVLTHGDQTWAPTLTQLGVAVDYDATLDAAFGIGREESAWERVGSTFGLLRNDRHVPLLMTFNPNAMNDWFDTVNNDLGIPPHNAYIVVEDGKARIEAEVDGTVVDSAAVRNMVITSLTDLQPLTAQLPVEVKIASVRAGDLEPAKAILDEALSAPVVFTHEDNEFSLAPEIIGQFVVQTVDESLSGEEAVGLELDIKALAKYLSTTYRDEINRDAVDAEVAFDNERGRLIATSESVTGLKLKPSSFAQAVSASFFGNHSEFEVPVSIMAPLVDSNNLDALGITTKLAVGDSSYVGSDYGRSTNIVVGSNLLNGTLIPPGGEYSFNRSIGVITIEKGYVESSVIEGERIGRDIGGGICQVSTTVFRAALYAGLEIIEWWPHSYRLGFYEQDGWLPGMDASILQPDGNPFGGGDFRFRNPTDSWMLVESYTQNERVYVIIYGPDTGYSVEISTPFLSDPIQNDAPDIEQVNSSLPAGTVQQTEWEQAGYQVWFSRTVRDADGNQIEYREFSTYFYSRPNVYQVSPDMVGRSPASS